MNTHTLNRTMLFIFSLSSLMLFNVTAGIAQEGSFDVNNPSYGVPEEYEVVEVINPEEALIISDKEYSNSQKIVSKKEKKSTKVDSSKQKTSAGANPGYASDAKEAESVLSFNVLYYIIQKFKFTDVVDQ